MPDTTTPHAVSLDDLFAAGQARFGDYRQAYDADGSVAVLRHPIRLSGDTRKKIIETGTRISEVQADPPEVDEARKKLNAAQNRLDSLGEDASAAVRQTHTERVKAEQDNVTAAIEQYGKPEDEQAAAVRGVVHDMIRAAVAEPAHAEGLIAALGDDLPVHIALVERYMAKVQAGEAPPSAS